MMRLCTSLLIALLYIPFIPTLIWSFTTAWPWPNLVPVTLTLRPWQIALDHDTGFIAGMLTSLIIASCVAILALILSLPISRFLVYTSSPIKAFLEIFTVAPILFPSFIAAIGLFEIFIHLNMTDSIMGIIIIHLIATSPYMIKTLNAGYAALGVKLEHQARTLGATELQIALNVTLPRLAPDIINGCIFVFLASLGEYILATLIGGGTITTLPLVLFPYIAAGDRSLSAVGSVLLCLAPLTFMIIIELFAYIGRKKKHVNS